MVAKEVRAHGNRNKICGETKVFRGGRGAGNLSGFQGVSTPSSRSQPEIPATNLRVGEKLGVHLRVVVVVKEQSEQRGVEALQKRPHALNPPGLTEWLTPEDERRPPSDQSDRLPSTSEGLRYYIWQRPEMAGSCLEEDQSDGS